MKKILVMGASGFVGSNLTKTLLADGYAVRCLARTPSKIQDLATAGCEIVQGDISGLESIQNAVKSVDVVYISIHTLSVQPANKEGRNFMDIEMNGLQNIITACQMHGVKRVVYVTFIGASPNAPNQLSRDRWQAEQLLLNSGLDVTVIRPGMIVGVGGQGYNMVVSNAKKSFAVIMGSGQNRFQSIAVTDLAYYLVGVLNEPLTYGQCYEVGGDEILSMNEMVDSVADVLGRKHPMKFHLPLSLLKPLASSIDSIMKMPKGAMKAVLESIKDDLVGNTKPIKKILTRPLLSFKEATKKALLLP
jgi:uncharacterized protein YbjT (DUF2867 family)